MFFVKKKPTPLDLEIDRITELLGDLDPLDDDAKKALHYLSQLTEIRDRINPKSKMKVSGDAVVGALASIAGIVLILYREELHPVNSKALGFVKKPR